MSQAAYSLTETVYQSLRADILSCRLPPGEKVKIKEEADRLNASSSAVREALSRLTSEGLVVAEPQRGFRAAPISEAHLKDLTDVRIEIEALCIRRAVANATLDWEGMLLHLNHRLARTKMRSQDDDAVLSDDWVLAHEDFHAAIVSTCGSPTLLGLRLQLYQQSERYRRLSVPLDSSERDLADEHNAIITALVEHDADRAIALMTGHIATTTEILLNAKVNGQALLPKIAA